MPIYEYDCDHCNETLEAIQKIDEKMLVVCPRCGEASLRKKTSLNSFQLKGAGWYRDGYGDRKAGTASSEAKTNASSPAA